jgi:hypothetical protein
MVCGTDPHGLGQRLPVDRPGFAEDEDLVPEGCQRVIQAEIDHASPAVIRPHATDTDTCH